MAEEPVKPKRSNIIRRRRAGSMKVRPSSMSGINMSGCQRTQSEKCSSTDVSILVTEASPEGGSSGTARPLLHRQNSEATVVQVLVHRESEEYNNEEDEITEAESYQPNVFQATQIVRTLESAPTISDSQTIDRAGTRNDPTATDCASTSVTSMTDCSLTLENMLVTEGTTTDIVIDIDSNMSS